MSRPRGFADLAGHRVGVWGIGVEGRATIAALQAVGATVVAVDDNDLGEPDVLLTASGGFDALLECDIVLKSPGIPARRRDVLDLESRGVPRTSALAVWLAGTDRANVIAVTGTKGKSTTTSLIQFMLEACGESARSCGNIGLPPYDPAGPEATWTVLEVSSYQALDVTDAPGVVVVTSLGEDHLDWHGDMEQYVNDKLQLTRAEGHHLTVVPDDVVVLIHRDLMGGEIVVEHASDVELAELLGLIGQHNARNVALALHATAKALRRPVEDVRAATVRNATNFSPLPGRLTLVHRAQIDTSHIDFVDDGLATNVVAVLAAVSAVRGRPVTLIMGGFDRGVSYAHLAHGLREASDQLSVVVMGPAGERIADAVAHSEFNLDVERAADLDDAVARAVSHAAQTGGVVLFSPGAASFDQFKNWAERSAHFSALARRY